jgi:hypothetical protein
MKQTGLEVRPMFHWTPRRIEAHVKLCVLALQIQRAAELRCGQPWARIAHTLAQLKSVRYRSDSRTICSAHQNHRRARRNAEKAQHINAQADSSASPSPSRQPTPHRHTPAICLPQTTDKSVKIRLSA